MISPSHLKSLQIRSIWHVKVVQIALTVTLVAIFQLFNLQFYIRKFENSNEKNIEGNFLFNQFWLINYDDARACTSMLSGNKKRQLCDAKNASVLLAYADAKSASSPLLYIRLTRFWLVQSLKWFDSVTMC